MIRAAVIAAVLVVGVGGAVAQADPVKMRQAKMGQVAEGGGVLLNMVQNKAPFDLAAAKAALTKMQSGAQGFGNLFSEPPKTGEKTDALPKIWTDKAEFTAIAARFEATIAEVQAAVTDEASLKAEQPKIGRMCVSCHGGDKYATGLREIFSRPK